jgi:hypothetical protein
MTDSTTPQSVSTQSAYSPSVQKAISLGNKEYALKKYEKAVEHYGEASELQFSPPSQVIISNYPEPRNPVRMTQMSYSYTGKHYFRLPRRTVKSLEEHRQMSLHSV